MSHSMDYTQRPNTAYQASHQMRNQNVGTTPTSGVNNVQAQVHGNKYGSKWLFGLWDCCSPMSTCCLGCWCPCLLYGKTYAREHGEGETNGCSWMVSFNSMDKDVARWLTSPVLCLVLCGTNRLQFVLAVQHSRPAEGEIWYRRKHICGFLWRFVLSLLWPGQVIVAPTNARPSD